MSATNSRQFYQGKDSIQHSIGTGLLPDEAYLVRKHLAPRLRTLDAGTGDGRIPFALQELGFTDIHGFDCAPELIEAAKADDPSGSIGFQVQDPTRLDYPDESFHQLIYLGTILSSLGSPKMLALALKEAHRMAGPGALMIASFLNWESHLARPINAAYTRYLSLFRMLARERRPMQSQPWLKCGEWFNLAALRDFSPYLYYYKLKEIGEHIQLSGFQLLEIGSTYQISNCHGMYPGVTELRKHPVQGTLYVVCRKPANQTGD